MNDDKKEDKVKDFILEHGNIIVTIVVLVAVLLKIYVFK